MKCTYCNQEIKDGSKFCGACGRAVVEGIKTTEAQEAHKLEVVLENFKKQRFFSIMALLSFLGIVCIHFCGYTNACFNNELATTISFGFIKYLGGPGNTFINIVFLTLSGFTVYNYVKQAMVPEFYRYSLYILQLITKIFIAINLGISILNGFIFLITCNMGDIVSTIIGMIGTWLDLGGISFIALMSINSYAEKKLLGYVAKRYKNGTPKED